MNDTNQTSSSQTNADQSNSGIFGTPLSSAVDLNTNNQTGDASQSSPVFPVTTPPSNPVPTPSPQKDPAGPAEEDHHEWIPVSRALSPDPVSIPVLDTKDTAQEFKDLGVSVVDETSREDTPNIFSKESSFVSSDKEHKTLPKSQPAETKKDNTPIAPSPMLDTQSLEQDFSQTFNTPVASSSQSSGDDPLFLEEERLKKLHQELKDKASTKKQEVKRKLEQLKKEKEDLGRALTEIKEIEEIAGKIEEKLSALKSIDTDLDSLEAKAREELN